MNASIFRFPRLYHRPDKGAGEMVASSIGLSRVHWDEFKRHAPLTPPPSLDDVQGALGLYRGQTVDFILAHAHIDGRGKPGVQYVVLTADAMRQVGGRVNLLQKMMVAAVPDRLTNQLPVLSWMPPKPPTVGEQVDDLSHLMLMLDDDFKVIDDLLGALIQGIPIVVVNADISLSDRLKFIQGLLALLPVPARFGVTFATYVRRLEQAPLQIAFMATDNAPDEALCLDWEYRSLSGPRPGPDPYSRFIMQQLRLDPTLAVQQMQALTQAAGWRLTRQEPLNSALGWAAKRIALDSAVMDGQPADMEMVAAVLREDPTLTETLRVAYVRHLLAFTMALHDPEPSEIIGIQARQFPDVESAALEILDGAIADGKSQLVYTLIANWMSNSLGPEGSGWRRRAYAAATSHLQMLVAVNAVDEAVEFFRVLQQSPENMMLGEAVPELLETALSLAIQSEDLAKIVFLMAAEHLSAAPFQRLARMNDFNKQLPPIVQTGLDHFQPMQPTPAPQGMIVKMAASFGDEWDLVVLARLVEWVIALDRPDLIDSTVFEHLVRLAGSPWTKRYKRVLLHVVNEQSLSNNIILLDEDGLRDMVEILLLLEESRLATELMERISASAFRGDAQVNYAPWVSDVFENSSLPMDVLLQTLDSLDTNALKPVPRAMAYRGVLVNYNFDPGLEPIIAKLTSMTAGDPNLVRIVGYDVAVQLVQVYARRQDVESSLLLAATITSSLEGRPEGLAVVARIWTLLNWNKDVREAALELMRRYVRQVPLSLSPKIPEKVGGKLGAKVGEMLHATVVMSTMMGGATFERWAEDVHVAAALLCDLQAAYQNKPYPTLHRLRSDLDSMSGGMNEDERVELADNLITVGRLLDQLNQARGRRRVGQDQRLLSGDEVPRSANDSLLWLGGFLSSGQTIQPNLKRESMLHIWGHRSIVMVIEDVATLRRVLEQMAAAFPQGKLPDLTLFAFKAEIDSLWKSMSHYDQRRLRDDMAADTQVLAKLSAFVGEVGDGKALTDSSLGKSLATGKREPKTVLEVIRLCNGYYERKFGF